MLINHIYCSALVISSRLPGKSVCKENTEKGHAEEKNKESLTGLQSYVNT